MTTFQRLATIVALASTISCAKSTESDMDAFLSARLFRANGDTWLKVSDGQSSELPADQKCFVPAGTWLDLKGPPRYFNATHYRVELRIPLPDCPLTSGFVYMPHFPMNNETPPVATDPYENSRNYIRITRTGSHFSNGLEVLRVALVAPGGEVLNSVQAVSGSRYAQIFKTWRNSVSGSNQPVPEGEWILDPLYAYRGLTFAAEFGDYQTTFWQTDEGNTTASLGPVYAPVYYRYRDRDRTSHVNGRPRGEIGFHLDAGNPGTAGCIGIQGVPALRTLVGWFADVNSAPRRIFIDWGLGTEFDFPQPAPTE